MLTTALCAGNVNRILWHGTIPFRPCLPRSMMKARKKQSPRTNRHSPGASRRMRWWETSLNLRAGVDGCMPRTVRASVGDICYHVINRGNAQIEVFHKDGDYQTFVELIGLACQPIPMRLLAYCVMSNHFHLALWPHSDRDLGRWMQWLLTAHVRRYHLHYRRRRAACGS